MSRSSSRVTATTAILTAGTFYFLYRQSKKSRTKKGLDIKVPSDLVGNVDATGSDVVRLYGKQMENKLYIVTGATSGLGRYVATLLATSTTGAATHVILAVRNVAEGEVLANELRSNTNKVEVWHLDLSSLGSVRAFATKFRAINKKLDGLINNAGVYCLKGKTIDGYQTTWQTNAMAPALLTQLLLPHMTSDARIVFVTSEMERLVGLFGSTSFSDPPTSDGSSTWDYAYSKACQVLNAHDLTLRFQDSHKKIVAVEPGLVETKIARHASRVAQWVNYKLLAPFFLRSVDQGCATIMYCLLSPDITHGSYYYANCAPRATSKRYDNTKQVEAQARLFAELWTPKDK